VPYISKREWSRHERELSEAKARIQELERQNLHLLNSCLTKNGNFAIPAPSIPAPLVAEESEPVEMVQGYEKEDFINFEMESGYSRADALEMWERTVSTGLMPWQWDTPPFAKESEVVEQ
jgi:hypothetical protein